MAAAFQEQPQAPPDTGLVTLAEVHGAFLTLSGDNDPNVEKYRREHGVLYPHIVVPYVVGSSAPLSSPNVSAFLNPHATGERWLRRQVDHVRRLASSFSLEFPLATLSSPPDRLLEPDSPVVSLAWHRYRQVLAVVHRSDTVLVYGVSAAAAAPLTLQHAFQTGARCIAWRGTAGAQLAVGCSTGVLLWSMRMPGGTSNVAPAAGVRGSGASDGDEQAAWAHFWNMPHIRPASALCWSPCGRYLAIGGGASGAIVVQDVAVETGTTLWRHRAGITALAWSPDGTAFASAAADGTLRLWETRSWTSVVWAGIPSHVSHMEWTPDSRHLLFSCAGQSFIQCIEVTHRNESISARSLWTYSLADYEAVTEGGEKHCVGGAVRHFALDGTGERLAVCFDGPTDRAGVELIAVLSVQYSPLLQVFPRGFIRGPAAMHVEQSVPTRLAFAAQFDRGALLSASFTNGKVSFIPMLFVSEKRMNRNPQALLEAW